MKASNYFSLCVLVMALVLVPGVSAISQYNASVGAYTIVTFNGTGTMNWTAPSGVTLVNYAVVAGGGSGGAYYGGGGGAGGSEIHTSYPVVAGSQYTITVGTGGAAVTGTANGTAGTNSTVMNGTGGFISAKGGGYGGFVTTSTGGDGGSGGGAGGKASTTEYAGGSAVSGQGYRGGYHTTTSGGTPYPSAGGGGSGAVGQNNTGGPGTGGIGVASSITGTSVYYGGGGGGASESASASGGTGGGGAGNYDNSNGVAGTDGLGGGGGGSCDHIDGTAYSGKGGNGVVILSYITPIVTVAWGYSTPGTYYWVCPDGISSVVLKLAAGGGGGAGGSQGLADYAGGGGTAGGSVTVSSLTVTPGTNYTLVVGSGGANASYGSDGNSGTQTSGLGYSRAGGSGGLKLLTDVATDGGAGVFSTARYAFNGTNHSAFTYGVGGLGYGAGGGGGSVDLVDHNTEGGGGAKGYINITQSGYSSGNIPDFVGSPTTGSSGTLVHFTDLSTITDGVGLAYNWSFGDSTYSSTPGSVTHVYAYFGSYTVTLLLSSTAENVSTIKENYINIVNQQSQYVIPTAPKSVRFQIVDAFGAELPGALITVNYINSSLPSTTTSWLVSTFGVNQSVADEMTNSGLAMQGFTGSDGGVSFVMFPVIKYGLTITNATAGLSKYITIYPQDTDYTIKCPLTSQAAPVSRQTQLANTSIYVTEPNASWVIFNVVYQDVSGDTTNVKWNLTCLTNRTVIYSKDFGDPDTNVKTDNYTVSTLERGTEYRAMMDATRDV